MVQVERLNGKLQEKIDELTVKLAENQFKEKQIQVLKYTKGLLENKCGTDGNVEASNGLTEELVNKVAQLRSIILSLKENIQLSQNTQLKLLNQLQNKCDGHTIQNSGPIIGSISNGMNDFIARSSNCLPMGQQTTIATIEIPRIGPTSVLCDGRTAGPGWLVIQRRFDGSQDFYRSWAEYRNGFGQLGGDYFIGLETLYRLTSSEPHELYIHLENFNGMKSYARYSNFQIGGEDTKYELRMLGAFSGTAGDRLSGSLYSKFSTYDQDNNQGGYYNTAVSYHGGWWYFKNMAEGW